MFATNCIIKCKIQMICLINSQIFISVFVFQKLKYGFQVLKYFLTVKTSSQTYTSRKMSNKMNIIVMRYHLFAEIMCSGFVAILN